jgi:adsorption protein B
VAVCPHDGPTSKGDCLNWTYQAMLEYEHRRGVDFEIIMTHDAEDLVHPESLLLINWFSRDYEMVQIPVLPLGTPWREWTHGIYCDEFAEYQFKDIPVRQKLGGFLPSNGVGTGFERTALESLRREHAGRIFDPQCLTEDYENGFRMHAAGYRQIFVPIRLRRDGPVATREYFPRKRRAAIRQRSRWVAGIALQGWQRHGWRAPVRQLYWFWRDRKGLIGNLLSPLANVPFLYWLCTLVLPTGVCHWRLEIVLPHWLTDVCLTSMGIAAVQTSVRVHLCARIYGARFAAGAPLRVFWANIVNFAATVQALEQFAMAHLRQHSLEWRKTEHVYPGIALQTQVRPRLGEVLISLRFISTGELEEALSRKRKGQRIGESLMEMGKLTEEQLFEALAWQSRSVATAAGD